MRYKLKSHLNSWYLHIFDQKFVLTGASITNSHMHLSDQYWCNFSQRRNSSAWVAGKMVLTVTWRVKSIIGMLTQRKINTGALFTRNLTVDKTGITFWTRNEIALFGICPFQQMPRAKVLFQHMKEAKPWNWRKVSQNVTSNEWRTNFLNALFVMDLRCWYLLVFSYILSQFNWVSIYRKEVV